MKSLQKSFQNKLQGQYNHTINASYLGYITQAIVNNLAPLLFLTFQKEFQVSLGQITFITTFNFLVQLLVDLVSVKFVDKIGYRKCAVIAHLLAGTGLIFLAILPGCLPDAFAGIMIAVVIYAVGGGLIEVLISPIVEACPTDNKESVMSLLHSFYCWGHVGVVLISTAFFYFVGIENWRILAILWAMIPFANLFYFMVVPIYSIVEEGEGLSVRDLLKEKMFWLFMVLMVCAGASEQGMSQWSSAFAEAGLGASKVVGDLAGPCAFALCMGTARALYGKYGERVSLKRTMVASGMLCVVCYLLAALAGNPVLALLGCAMCGFSVGIFWPGAFSMASATIAKGGTALFALMALAGDVGCSLGPTVVGKIAAGNGGDLSKGLLWAIIFPVLLIASMLFVRRNAGSMKKE